jgi:hypothetical protein
VRSNASISSCHFCLSAFDGEVNVFIMSLFYTTVTSHGEL